MQKAKIVLPAAAAVRHARFGHPMNGVKDGLSPERPRLEGARAESARKISTHVVKQLATGVEARVEPPL